MTTQRRLGRGLEALLGQPFGTEGGGEVASNDSGAGEMHPAFSIEAAPNGEAAASRLK